jgi:6-phosphofructokinase 1
VAYDRVLGTRFGIAAVDAASNGEYGVLTALRGTAIELIPLDEALQEPKLLDPDLFATAEVFFG